MKIDPVNILLNKEKALNKKFYFISGNEITLMKKIEDLIIEIVHEYEKLNKTNIEFIFINDNSTKDKFNIRGQISFLRQAVQNIIDNAVSFSKYGDKITINLSSTSNYTSLSISDNGPGIKEPIFEKIFDRFYSLRDEVDDTYGRIMLGSNTNKGYAYNIAFTARKKFGNNLNTNLTFSYGDAYTIFDGTSSINSSQWRNMETQRGKNSTLDIARSDFAQGGRVIANVSYKKEWNNNLTTQIGVFYEGRNQSPFTYIYNDRRDLFNDDSRDNALMYVPNNASEINLTDPTQWSQLNQYISNNDYLNNRRGGYAERNGDMGPWSDIVDLRFVQDIAINTGKRRNAIQLTADIFNFSNLLNKDWGRKFSPGNQQILRTVTGAPNPEFDVLTSNFNLLPDDRGIQSSRWQAQLGLRYTFN